MATKRVTADDFATLGHYIKQLGDILGRLRVDGAGMADDLTAFADKATLIAKTAKELSVVEAARQTEARASRAPSPAPVPTLAPVVPPKPISKPPRPA